MSLANLGANFSHYFFEHSDDMNVIYKGIYVQTHIYLFGCAGSWLWHMLFTAFVLACRIFSCSMQDLVP